MGYFIEGILELLFGIFKSKPEQMSNEIQYKEKFSIYFNKTTGVLVLSILGLSYIALLIFAYFLNDNDTEYLMYFLAFMTFILFILFLIAFSFKSIVNTEKIIKTTFFFFKKEIFWCDIICLRIVENSNDSDVIIALYSKNKKCVYDTSSNYENAWQLVKMAEQKSIKIRKEKDLSIKQIHNLD